MEWVIPNKLARSSRPGYPSKSVGFSEVENTVSDWKKAGVRSVLCLLSPEQLDYYNQLKGGLLSFYRQTGLLLGHVPIEDHQLPPVSVDEMRSVIRVYSDLPKPCLVHCSAGVDRTGAVVAEILINDEV